MKYEVPPPKHKITLKATRSAITKEFVLHNKFRVDEYRIAQWFHAYETELYAANRECWFWRILFSLGLISGTVYMLFFK